MEQLQSHICLMASSYKGKYLRISSYIRYPFHKYDFATAPLWISLNMRKILFSFLSVYLIEGLTRQTARTSFALHFLGFTISVSETRERIGLQPALWNRNRNRRNRNFLTSGTGTGTRTVINYGSGTGSWYKIMYLIFFIKHFFIHIYHKFVEIYKLFPCKTAY